MSAVIHLLWPNGECTSGETWEEVEENARDAQWSPYSQEEFREEMARRAMTWAGREPPVGESSEEFIRALNHVDMFMIIEEDDDSEDAHAAA